MLLVEPYFPTHIQLLQLHYFNDHNNDEFHFLYIICSLSYVKLTHCCFILLLFG